MASSSLGFILSRTLYGLSIIFLRHSQTSKCSLYVPEGKAKTAVAAILILCTAACAFFMLRMNLTVGLACLAGAAIAFLYYCWVAYKHFGGITEDIASFFVQVCEILIPLMALLVYPTAHRLHQPLKHCTSLSATNINKFNTN